MMLKHILRVVNLAFFFMLVAGCASMGGANNNIALNNPEAYGDYQIDAMSNKDVIGKEALLGGMVTTMNNHNDYIKIEVVRYNLNANGFPINNSELDNERLVVNVFGTANVKGYSPGSYIAAVGIIKSADTVDIGGDKIRILTMDATDYQMWLNPQQQGYYDEPFFNSPSIGVGYWGGGPSVGFGFGFGNFGGFPYF